MKNFIAIEVGSTNVKIARYDGQIIELPDVPIAFKANYKALGRIDDNDLKQLYDLIATVKGKSENVFVYGTSIFRELNDGDRAKFLSEFKARTGVDFNIVSPEQECEYTVKGAVMGDDFTGRVAVMIGGGGSTEVAIVENKKIIEKHLNKYGVQNVREAFPRLNDLHPNLTMEEVIEFCLSRTEDIEHKSEILILAGGDYIRYYDAAGREFLEKNDLYDDPAHPYKITVQNDSILGRRYVMDDDLNDYIARYPEYAAWWNGTREMRFCVAAVAKKSGAKIIIPTRVNMLKGIIEGLL